MVCVHICHIFNHVLLTVATVGSERARVKLLMGLVRHVIPWRGLIGISKRKISASLSSPSGGDTETRG